MTATIACPVCNGAWQPRLPVGLSPMVLRNLSLAFAMQEYGVSLDELHSHRKGKPLVEARALVVWAAKSFGPVGLSYPRIGRWLGGRDHSTIMHMWREIVPRLQQYDAEFAVACSRFPDFALQSFERKPHAH